MLKLAATLPILLGTLFAQPHGSEAGGHQGRGGGMIERLLSPQAVEHLGLTDAQQDRIREIADEHEEKVLDLRHQIENGELELRRLREADNPSENQIKNKIRELGNLRIDMQLAQVDMHFDIREVLTAEQIELINEFRAGHGGPRPGAEHGSGPHPESPPPSPSQENPPSE